MSEPDAFKISEAVIDLWRCYTIERDMAKELEAENARLKAEVERLTNNCNYLDQKLDEELDKSAMLCGQVERLTKAGDEMDRALTTYAGNMKDNCFQCQLDWNAAKEGKPRA